MARKLIRTNNRVLPVLIGVVVALLVCVALLMGYSWLLLTQKAGEGTIEWVLSAILIASSIAGNGIAGKISIDGVTITSMIVTGSLLFSFLLLGLLHEGQFQNVVFRVASIVVGSVIACLICLKKTRGKGKRKMHYR